MWNPFKRKKPKPNPELIFDSREEAEAYIMQEVIRTGRILCFNFEPTEDGRILIDRAL